MSSIIGNDDTNKQWAVVNVVFYSKKMLKCVKYKISKLTVDKHNKGAHIWQLNASPTN